jgi:predicted TPR repeat methyltransferase
MLNTETTSNPDYLVDLGEEHHKAGRLKEAEAFYSNALKADPGHPGALYYLANIAYEDGRLRFAIRLLEDLLRSEPNDAEAWHLLGMVLFQKNYTLRAIESFKKALAIQPAYPQANYSLGNAFNKQGNPATALTYFQRAATLNPAFADAYCAIGNIFLAQKKFDEAKSNYQQAINAKSDCEVAYEGIGGIFLSQGKWDEAITIYSKALTEIPNAALLHVGLGTAQLFKFQYAAAVVSLERAIALDPNCFMAHLHLGDALYKQGKFNEAANSFQRAIALNPQDTRLLKSLAKKFLFVLQAPEKAAEIYRQWLAQEPNNPVAHHHLAACTGKAVPMRATDAYVEQTFDEFAEKFDSTLGQLNYCGPQLLAGALQRQCGPARKQFALLDAGCGTGLCGPLVTEYAAHLTGVDLSAGMLAKAKLRNVYDVLIKSELTAYLRSQSKAFDVVLLADTLIYFGELESVFTASRTAIRDGGYLFFTVESFIPADGSSESGSGYHLNPHGRYSHTEAYVKQTLSKAGFTIVELKTAALRHEGLLAVPGLIVSCRADAK